MKVERGFVRAAVVAGIVALGGPAAGQPAEGDSPPRPGQLRGVLSALKAEGADMARTGTGWLLRREYPVQLLHMATAPRAMSGGGWYRPSQGRYGWEWLRKTRDADADGSVTVSEFGGPREWFEALDRDRDGALTKDDFDWAAGSPLAAATAKAKPLFGQIDRDSNGRATPDEWKLWFDTLAGGKGYISQDDIIPLFLERKAGRGAGTGPMKTPDPKTRLAIVCSYISGDVGSPSEGPGVGEVAPSFSLPTVDGKGRFSLSKARERKPLVLIFGSFT